MGFIDTSPALPAFYNLVHAVGKYSPNQKDDVMLVQYLLKNWYGVVKPKEAVPKGEMKVDGVCGGVTLNWILKFQLDLMLSKRSIYADGRIDRIRNTATLTGDISHTTYTLAWLNSFVGSSNPTAFIRLPQFVPLQNIGTVPPPSNDMVFPPRQVPATGGL